MNETSNPYVSCGACCAHFRVSFYWAEADDAGGPVPTELTEPLSLLMRNMRGTNDRTSPMKPALVPVPATGFLPFHLLCATAGARELPEHVQSPG